MEALIVTLQPVLTSLRVAALDPTQQAPERKSIQSPGFDFSYYTPLPLAWGAAKFTLFAAPLRRPDDS